MSNRVLFVLIMICVAIEAFLLFGDTGPTQFCEHRVVETRYTYVQVYRLVLPVGRPISLCDQYLTVY